MHNATEAQGISGRRFGLRLPPALHRELEALAFETGISMNEYCCYAVERVLFEARVDRGIVAAKVVGARVERARE